MQRKLSKTVELKMRCKQSAIVIRALLSELDRSYLNKALMEYSEISIANRERKKIISTAGEHASVLDALTGVTLNVDTSKTN